MERIKGKVLLVDDDQNYLELYHTILVDEFDVYAFSCASDALLNIHDINPHTIILDLNLPDLNGFEFCNQLKDQNYSLKHSDIIFVSGETSLSKKMLAFDIGAVDFLSKPFQVKELRKKVSTSIDKHLLYQMALEEAKVASSQTHVSAELTMSYKKALFCFRSISSCKDFNSLISRLSESIERLGFNAAIYIRPDVLSDFRGGGKVLSEDDDKFSSLASYKAGIKEFNNHLLFNSEYVSILIRKVASQKDYMLEIQDHILSIAYIVDDKIRALYAQSHLGKLAYEFKQSQMLLAELCKHSFSPSDKESSQVPYELGQLNDAIGKATELVSSSHQSVRKYVTR